MIDITRPIMLRDGTRLIVGDGIDTTTFKRPSISVGLAVPDDTRREPDLFHWCRVREANAFREFFLDTGLHVFDETKDQVVNVIDWEQPIELDDGTPLKLKSTCEHTANIKLARAAACHSAFPIDGHFGNARLANGLVISNHKFHVRNRTMTKIIDTTKALEVNNGRNVTFITETSEGHILVGTDDSFSGGWIIFAKDGSFVRSPEGNGRGLVLRNKIDRHVCYQPVAKGYILSWIHSTEAKARAVGGQIVRVTSEDGRVVSVELLS